MKIKSLPVDSTVPVVSLELSKEEAGILSAMMLYGFEFETVPFAKSLYEALHDTVPDLEEPSYKYKRSIDLFVPAK